jgi:hypothetical protein
MYLLKQTVDDNKCCTFSLLKFNKTCNIYFCLLSDIGEGHHIKVKNKKEKNMPGELIPIVLFLTVPLIIKIVSDNSIKKQLIEKGLVNEKLKYLYSYSFDRGVPVALKWGMVSIAIGLAIFVAQVSPIDIRHEMTFSAMLIFGGAALILYYFVAKKIVKKQQQE